MSLRWKCWLSLLLGGAGCADPSGRYADFERRAADSAFDAGAGGSRCTPPPPNALSGPALLAVETTLGAGLPILFFGPIETPEMEGKTHVLFRYRALDASDRRTPVGEELAVGPIAVEADGTFRAAIPEGALPGSANPILPGIPIVSVLELSASICGVTNFYCGTVSGNVISPVRGAVTGRFGLTLLGTSELPAQPRYGCEADAIAAPL